MTAFENRGRYLGDDPKGTWLAGWFQCPKHHDDVYRHVLLQPRYGTTRNLNCGMRYSPTIVRMEDNLFLCGVCGYWQIHNGPWHLGIGETDTSGEKFEVVDIKQFYQSVLRELGKSSGQQKVVFMSPRGKNQLNFDFQEGSPRRSLFIEDWKLPSTYLQEGTIAEIQQGESKVIGPMDAILWAYYIFLGAYYPPWFMKVTNNMGPVGIYKWESPQGFAWIPGVGLFEDESDSQHYREGMTRSEAMASGISLSVTDAEKAKAEERRRNMPLQCPECGLPLVKTADDRLYCQNCSGLLHFDGRNWTIMRQSPRSKEAMEFRKRIDDLTRR